MLTRAEMVSIQIECRGIRDKRVLAAMHEVPRHLFVPDDVQSEAYNDYPLPIGYEQTISQPYIVALMCELAGLTAEDRVLEIGTGSGYNAAVISRIAAAVYSLEIIPELSFQADSTLKRLGYDNVVTRVADGYDGWQEEAPFDAILITAACDHIPPQLLKQLSPNGGRLVMPLGEPGYSQELIVASKNGEQLAVEGMLAVRFVPLTGNHER